MSTGSTAIAAPASAIRKQTAPGDAIPDTANITVTVHIRCRYQMDGTALGVHGGHEEPMPVVRSVQRGAKTGTLAQGVVVDARVLAENAASLEIDEDARLGLDEL